MKRAPGPVYGAIIPIFYLVTGTACERIYYPPPVELFFSFIGTLPGILDQFLKAQRFELAPGQLGDSAVKPTFADEKACWKGKIAMHTQEHYLARYFAHQHNVLCAHKLLSTCKAQPVINNSRCSTESRAALSRRFISTANRWLSGQLSLGHHSQDKPSSSLFVSSCVSLSKNR